MDDALAKLGTIGRWQVLYYTMISTGCMVPTCFHMLAINYIGKSVIPSREIDILKSLNLLFSSLIVNLLVLFLGSLSGHNSKTCDSFSVI